MIHVVAIITAKSGMREAILKEFHANMQAVHAEARRERLHRVRAGDRCRGDRQLSG